jgi:hypothetical protein
MSKDVRQLAIDKGTEPAATGDVQNSLQANLPLTVHNIVQKIGYPTKSPDIRDPSMLQKYYKSVTTSKTAFFQNTVSISRADVEREWAKAGKLVDRDEWGMTASTVNVGPEAPIQLGRRLTVLTRPTTILLVTKLYSPLV